MIVVPVPEPIGSPVRLENFVAHPSLACTAQQPLVVRFIFAKIKIELAVFITIVLIRTDTGQSSRTRIGVGRNPSSGTVAQK